MGGAVGPDSTYVLEGIVQQVGRGVKGVIRRGDASGAVGARAGTCGYARADPEEAERGLDGVLLGVVERAEKHGLTSRGNASGERRALLDGTGPSQSHPLAGASCRPAAMTDPVHQGREQHTQLC